MNIAELERRMNAWVEGAWKGPPLMEQALAAIDWLAESSN